MKASSLPYGLIARGVQARGLEAVTEWVGFCVERGLDGVEIAEHWLHSLDWLEVHALLEQLRRSNLAVSAFNAFNSRTNCAIGEPRNAAVREMRRYLDMADRFGARIMIIGSGEWADYERYRMSRSEAVDNTVATIERCLPLAERKGIVLAIENHPGWLTRYADVLAQILERLPSAHLGLNLDTGSLYREGQRPDEVLRYDVVARKAVYVHLKSIRFEPEPDLGRWDQSVSFEESQVDYAGIFATLKAVDFDGWVSYESSAEVGLEGIARGVSWLRSAWPTW